MHGLCGMLISKMGDVPSSPQAHSFARIFDQGMTASQPSCFDGCPSRRSLFKPNPVCENRRDSAGAALFCHSERSEESLIDSVRRGTPCPTTVRDPSHLLRMTCIKVG